MFAIIVFMSLQAGEGQAEIRGNVKAATVSVCPGCSAGSEQPCKDRWMNIALPLDSAYSTPPQHCVPCAHHSHFGKEGLNKLRNRRSRAVFEGYSCISCKRDKVAEA